ncbi:hypothetical protein RN001_010050 [Aquatica leii]|uniref:RPA43 OB domain-containing protein n=1 Tax=Aquatica leii TaxID=1421715 RepID=A0AAN7SFW7_9COLE|nr:hypothetical protein RN001_010050 [Aquatica leii]
MTKAKSIISFDKSFLRNLVNDENSCVKLQEEKYHLALHPYHLTNINSSIKDLLGRGIAKYDKKLRGILLGYENIKLVSDGTIVDDSFFVHIDVTANFFLFKPEIDKVLTGVVNKKSEDHVGCLVYETFNASIPKPEEEDVNNWIGSKVEIGEEISFKITFLKLDVRLPYIRGEFILNTNNEENLNDEEYTSKKKKKKKSSKRRETEVIENTVVEEQSPKKHSKREKSEKKKKSNNVPFNNDESNSSKIRFRDESNDSIEIHRPKKKSKKSHKEKHEKSLHNQTTVMFDNLDTLNDSLKDNYLINGELEDSEHVKKKKKKHKSYIDDVSNDPGSSILKQLHKDSEIIDNDSPKKKKKKKKDKF